MSQSAVQEGHTSRADIAVVWMSPKDQYIQGPIGPMNNPAMVSAISEAGAYGMLALGLFGMVVSLTMGALEWIMPEEDILRFVGLLLFDVGAVIWLAVFIYYANGTVQRAISILMFLACFIGTALMVALKLLQGGQQFVTPPPELGMVATYGVIAMIVISLGATYLYHLSNPETWAQFKEQVVRDQIEAKSYEQLEDDMEEIANDVAKDRALVMRRQALQRMGVNPDDYLLPDGSRRVARKGPVIEGSTARVIESKQPARRFSTLKRMMRRRSEAATYASETEPPETDPTTR